MLESPISGLSFGRCFSLSLIFQRSLFLSVLFFIYFVVALVLATTLLLGPSGLLLTGLANDSPDAGTDLVDDVEELMDGLVAVIHDILHSLLVALADIIAMIQRPTGRQQFPRMLEERSRRHEEGELPLVVRPTARDEVRFVVVHLTQSLRLQ